MLKKPTFCEEARLFLYYLRRWLAIFIVSLTYFRPCCSNMASSKLVAWSPSSHDVFAVCGSRLELWKVTEEGEQRSSKMISASSTATNVSCMDWQSIEEDALLAHGSTSGKIGLVRWHAEGNSEVGYSIFIFHTCTVYQ